MLVSYLFCAERFIYLFLKIFYHQHHNYTIALLKWRIDAKRFTPVYC